jgi:hypothetical protein
MEKEQMLANRDVSKYVPKMLKKLAFFCIWNMGATLYMLHL